jgi:arylsulfatase A-like enzyme
MNLRIKLYKTCLTLCVLALLVLQSCINNKTEEQSLTQPNIIYILADDLGYGDLACYGQTKFETPNLDRLAAEGMLFTQHYAGSTVCAPSRSALLTGQHTGHTPIRGNSEVQPEGQMALPAASITVAEALQGAGYFTGAFGKWGLGYPGSEGDPVNQGFDKFFGYNCQRIAHRYYPEYLWQNKEKFYLPGNDWTNTITYAPDVIQEKVLDFIANNNPKKTGNPFFLYYPSTIPHAELIAPGDSLLEKFSGKFSETPFKGGNNKKGTLSAAYGPDIYIPAYCPQEQPRATFAAMISRLDMQVGQIVLKLEELGIADNTIIIFSSDNGPHKEGGADPDFFDSNGPLKGYKRDLYEGGIRVPMIVKWPGIIAANSKTDHVSAFWDIMPTLLEIAKSEIPVNIDGISFLPTLLQEDGQIEHENLYWEFIELGGRRALRMGNWKLVEYNSNKGNQMTRELFDLSDDPSEVIDLADTHPDIVENMLEILASSHTALPDK